MGSVKLGSLSTDFGWLHKYEVKRLSTRRCSGSVLRVRGSVATPPPSLHLSKATVGKAEKKVRVAVLGASGYTGSEIVRLLANHPQFYITIMTADRKAGQSIGSVFPHLVTQDLPDLVTIKDADFSKVDAVFCCLPHGTTQEIIKGLPEELKIVDLSADFRLKSIDEYETWYGQPHKAPELQVPFITCELHLLCRFWFNLMLGFCQFLTAKLSLLLPLLAVASGLLLVYHEDHLGKNFDWTPLYRNCSTTPLYPTELCADYVY